MKQWKSIIEAAWENRALLKETATQQCIRSIIEEIDKGRLRTAEPTANGWQLNDWIKKAVVRAIFSVTIRILQLIYARKIIKTKLKPKRTIVIQISIFNTSRLF